MTADPVLNWAGLARRAERQTGIPANVLLGLIAVESGGREGLTSSAGAGGLTQFTPGTAASYHVNITPGHAWSQILGAARYLQDLGYKRDPELALKSYNAGPGNPQAAGDYADKVMAAARKYTGVSGPAPPAPSTTAPTSDDDGLIGEQERSGAVRALTWLALATSGIIIAALGAGRSLGLGRPAP